MEFEKYLKVNAQKIESATNKLLAEFLKDAQKTNPKLVPFAKALINSCTGGKGIRGVLCVLGFELTGGRDKEIYKIGAAFEILHAALLIHDDIMDQSLTRRGKPSLHQVLGGKHYGLSQAISMGDIGLYLPIKIICETGFSSAVKLNVIKQFSQIIINTGWGQVMDVLTTQQKPSLNDLKFINTYKTAKYTIAGPMIIGAILGGGEKLSKFLDQFGENLGIAFQLKDDILDNEAKNQEKTWDQAQEYVQKAKNLIPKLTKDEARAKLLNKMSDYIIERSK